MSTKKSLIFDSLDVITHNDRHDFYTIESPLLDDSDALMDNHMSGVFGDNFVIETSIEMKFHCTVFGVVSVVNAAK